jgi:hypothetical protein
MVVIGVERVRSGLEMERIVLRTSFEKRSVQA